ncbi:MAG: TerC/Alx family metal homeostasis membrane protein [Stackebrandtia sp.]
MWGASIVVLLALLVADFIITRKPHTVSMREAVWWSVFYLALPFIFTLGLWPAFGAGVSLDFLTGFVVEKSLSVDNLFVFMLILTGFAVPEEMRQRVLLFGVVGAIILRAVFIAMGAAMLQAGTWAFLVFGLILLASAVKILHGAITGADQQRDVSKLRSVRLLRRVVPVTADFRGTRMWASENGHWAITPLAVVVFAVFATDIVFAVDSVPAVYGITADPYLVFTTNAFALLGLRALYFVLQSLLAKLRHLNYGLAVILAFIGVKLALHWAHSVWPAVPTIPTPVSLALIVVALAVVTVTSFVARHREERATVGSKSCLRQYSNS